MTSLMFDHGRVVNEQVDHFVREMDVRDCLNMGTDRDGAAADGGCDV